MMVCMRNPERMTLFQVSDLHGSRSAFEEHLVCWITSKRGIQIWGNGHHIYTNIYTHTLFLLSFPHISFSATVLYYFSIAFGSWNFAHLLWYCFFLFPVAIGRFWRFAGCCFISSVRGGRLKDDASHGRSFKFWAPYVVPSVERS